MKRVITLGMAALAFAGLAVWWWGPQASQSPPSDAPAGAGAPSKQVPPSAPEPRATTDSQTPEPIVHPKEQHRVRRIDPAKAAMLREALVRAARDAERKRRVEAPRGEEEAPPGEGTLSKEYIQDAVGEITPLIKECYEMALTEDPKLAGKLVTHFSIIGDPELGGVVESSELVESASTLRHPSLDECVRETMYGLELPAPEAGGRVEVTYPFVFRNDEG